MTTTALSTVQANTSIVNQMSSVSQMFSSNQMFDLNQMFNPNLHLNKNEISNSFNNIQVTINEAAKEQEKLNNLWTKGIDKAGNLTDIMSLFGKATQVAEATIVPAAQEQSLQDMFTVKTGNKDVGAAMFNKLRDHALATGQDVTQSLTAALDFTKYTKNSDQLQSLTDLAARMSVLNPGQSIGDTSSAIMDAMNGDMSKLASDFQIPEDLLQAAHLGEMMGSGNMEGFIASFDKILQQQGMTQQAMETMMDSPVNQWMALLGSFNGALTEIGQGALAVFGPLLDTLNQAFQDGTFQPLIDGLTVGFSVVAQMIAWVVEGALWLWSVLSQYSAFIPIVLGIVAAIGAFVLVMALVNAAVALFNLLANANPIGLIIAGVVALITVFIALLSALQPVRDVFASVFTVMGKIVAGFVIGAITMFEEFLNSFVDAINLVLSGVNSIINAVGSFIGIKQKIDLEVDRVDFSQVKNNVKNGIEGKFNAAADFTKNFDIKNIVKLPGKGDTNALAQYDQNVKTPKLPETTVTPKVPSVPTAAVPVVPQGGTINRVGSVDDTVDVSSEDLKVMRDLAEVQAITQMISLTPTVQMTTGDIHSDVDMDTVISRINQTLNEQFVSSAEGVYL